MQKVSRKKEFGVNIGSLLSGFLLRVLEGVQELQLAKFKLTTNKSLREQETAE